jgi:opacity protein-like surface antigen
MVRRLQVLIASFVLILAGAIAPLPANAAVTVPVAIGGNHCYTGGKLAYWKFTADWEYTSGNIYGTSTSVSLGGGRAYTFTAQAWCKYGFVIGAGRKGQQRAWVYSSGYQPRVTIYLW